MWLYILGAAIVVFFLFALLGSQIEKKQIREILTDIQQLEAIYTDFVEQKINHQIIHSSDGGIDIEQLHRDTLAYLKPHIDSVINHINKLDLNQIDIPNKSTRFNNVTSTAELLISNKAKNEDKQLTVEQTDTFVQSVKDTIYSDLQERVLRIP